MHPLRKSPSVSEISLSCTSVSRPQSRYTVSRIECRIKCPQNQRCRAEIALHPPKSRCRTFLRIPLSHFLLIRSMQGARRAGGGYRGTFGFRKRIALQRGIAATITPIALLCATKFLRDCAKILFILLMAKAKTMVLVVGFQFPVVCRVSREKVV